MLCIANLLMELLVKQLAFSLIELLAIPLGYPKSVAKWLVISDLKTVKVAGYKLVIYAHAIDWLCKAEQPDWQ